MTLGLIDTHAHLMDSAFDADRQAVFDRATRVGISALLIVGYDLTSSQAAIELAEQHPHARAAVGIHPNSAAAATPSDFYAVRDLAQHPAVIAIGETGLDYYRDWTPPAQQRQALDWHLDLAAELQKPVVVHNRQADSDVAAALEAFSRGKAAPGVLHCFSSTDAVFVQRVLQTAFLFSFAGPLTYKSSAPLRDIARALPLDRLLVETDCPYLPPATQRGRRNEPAFLRETAACLADLHGLTLDALIPQLWSNTARVFPALAEPRRIPQEVA